MTDTLAPPPTWNGLMRIAARAAARAEIVLLHHPPHQIPRDASPQLIAAAALPILQGLEQFLNPVSGLPPVVYSDTPSRPLEKLRDAARLIADHVGQLIAGG